MPIGARRSYSARRTAHLGYQAESPIPSYQQPPGGAAQAADGAADGSEAMIEDVSPEMLPGDMQSMPDTFGDDCAMCDSGEYGGECDRPFDVWGRVEYLLWWTQGSRTPPLVTTSTAGGAGTLGAIDTQILFGNDSVDDELRSGGRFTAGAWLDDCHEKAIEASFFIVEDSSTGFEAQSLGQTLIARPFFNMQLGTEAVQILSQPGVSTGGVFVSTQSELIGANALIRHNLRQDCCRRVDLLYGYRYLRLRENLTIRDELTSIDPGGNVPIGTVVGGFDEFDAINRFHGGDLGLEVTFQRSCWELSLLGKLGLGSSWQTVAIGGQTFVDVPGFARNVTGAGLLAQPSNIGTREREKFAFLPEFGLTLRCHVTQKLSATVGYTLLYLSEVARPGDQIDVRVDPRQITSPGTAQPFPAFTWVDADFWAQGLNLGLEYSF